MGIYDREYMREDFVSRHPERRQKVRAQQRRRRIWIGLLVGGVLVGLVGMVILQDRARRREKAELPRVKLERPESKAEALAMPRVHESKDPPIHLNTATMEELMTLPRVGPTLAERIMEGRPFDDVERLIKVQGIGEATLEVLRDHVTVE
tara:strand:- start:51 stop:500 length:450 start_codon:yes stop_codon:yes gene_type:complete